MVTSNMHRCYSYIRFSTPEQAQGDSLRRQTEMSEKYAQEHGLLLDKSLNLLDKGLSGYTGENRKKGALAVFLRAVEKKIVPPGSYLLVESLDRLSRDTLSEQMTLFMELINADIIVITLKDNQIYSKATIDTDISRLMLSLVIMMRSHEESSMKAHRLREAWKNKRDKIGKEKLTSTCPHWLKLNPERTAYLEIPERVHIVRRIYEMSLAGQGIEPIARTLNEEGIDVWGRGERKGKGWHYSYILRILRSRAVLGEFQPGRWVNGKTVPDGDPIPDYFPAVIDLPTWNKAQTRRLTYTPGRPGERLSNLFSGLAYDGYTKSVMRYNHSNSAKSNCYLVSDYGRMKRAAKAVRWRYDWFEKWFLDYIIRLDWAEVANEGVPAAEVALQKQLADQQVKVEELDKSLERYAQLVRNSDTLPETLTKDMRKLEIQREEANLELGRLESEVEHAANRRNALNESGERMRNLAASGDYSTRMRLREEIRKRVNRIDLFPKGIPAETQAAEEFPVPMREDQPGFKITFQNGAVRWVHCDRRKPGGDASILDENLPDHETPELELREQPETEYGAKKRRQGRRKGRRKGHRKQPPKAQRKILVPRPRIYKITPRKSRRGKAR